jgi:hypothetical protein
MNGDDRSRVGDRPRIERGERKGGRVPPARAPERAMKRRGVAVRRLFVVVSPGSTGRRENKQAPELPRSSRLYLLFLRPPSYLSPPPSDLKGFRPFLFTRTKIKTTRKKKLFSQTYSRREAKSSNSKEREEEERKRQRQV